MGRLLGVTGTEAIAVVLAAAAVYALVLIALRLLGARAATRLRTADVAVLVIVGAVLGRAILGPTPTLAGGAIAFGVLVVLRLGMSALERTSLRALLTARPLLLIADGEAVLPHLRRAAVSGSDLRVALRSAGVASTAEVVAAVLEPSGTISVTRRDPARPLDRRLFADVVGVERIADASFGPPIREQ